MILLGLPLLLRYFFVTAGSVWIFLGVLWAFVGR